MCVHSYYRLIRNAINYNSTIPKFRTGHFRYDAKNKEIEIAALTGVRFVWIMTVSKWASRLRLQKKRLVNHPLIKMDHTVHKWNKIYTHRWKRKMEKKKKRKKKERKCDHNNGTFGWFQLDFGVRCRQISILFLSVHKCMNMYVYVPIFPEFNEAVARTRAHTMTNRHMSS